MTNKHPPNNPSAYLWRLDAASDNKRPHHPRHAAAVTSNPGSSISQTHKTKYSRYSPVSSMSEQNSFALSKR